MSIPRHPTRTKLDRLVYSRSLTTGQTTVLSVDIGADIYDVAWYATVGSIEQYRSTPAELVAPDEPGSGWLIAVVRDAFGGVVWQAIAVTVQ